MPYVYNVRRVLRVIDGDTVDAEIALGFGLVANFRFRLAAVDTPEKYGRLSTTAGREATEYTEWWLSQRAGRLLVRTFKGSASTVGIGDGAFGRWLADFYTANGEHLADALISAGHARVV